jgi:hypothetical protein
VLRPCQQAKLARGAKAKEHAISCKLNSGIAVVGIDIGKNSFHVVGTITRRNHAAAEVVTRAGGNTARQLAAVLRLDGSTRPLAFLWRRAPLPGSFMLKPYRVSGWIRRSPAHIRIGPGGRPA